MAKKHTILYYKALNVPLSLDFYIYSELSGAVANDIHHICTREDRIENLMAVTREEHIEYGEKKHLVYGLLLTHWNFLDDNNIEYESAWFDEQMARWLPEQ